MTDALWCQDTCGGPAVLFFQSNLSRGSHWAPQHEALGDELRRIAPDQRGFGRSTGRPLPTSLLGLADDAVRLCAELGVDRAHVVGPLVPSGRPAGRGPLNVFVRRGIRPYVTTFEGLDAPCDHLQRRLNQFSVRPLALGTLYPADGAVAG